MIDRLIAAVLALIVAAAAVWFFNGKIRDYYQAPLIAAHKSAQIEAQKSTAKREGENKQRATDASSQKIKRLEAALLAANAASANAIGLRNNLRASTDLRANPAACLQYADTVNDILKASTELAGRIAKEADGHVADKVECVAAWPK